MNKTNTKNFNLYSLLQNNLSKKFFIFGNIKPKEYKMAIDKNFIITYTIFEIIIRISAPTIDVKLSGLSESIKKSEKLLNKSKNKVLL